MNCPNCSEPVEEGASFCGNCGLQIHSISNSKKKVPEYALPAAGQAAKETKALLSAIFGVVGILGTLLMPLIGLVFGIAGIAMGTMTRRSNKRRLSTAGIILSSFAVLIGFFTGVYGVKSAMLISDKTAEPSTQTIPNETILASAEFSTPCYSLNFVDRLNVSNSKNSCDLKALDGQSLKTSHEVYKIYASKSDITTVNALNYLGKKALEKDIAKTLPSFEIDSQQATTFAGSPAYVIKASDRSSNVAVIEAVVLHQTGTDKNLFVFLHAQEGKSTDLQTLEAQWRWK